MTELNENEKNIVNLINQLSEYANDETTTQEAIDRIREQIQQKTNESIRQQIEDADKSIDRPKVEFPNIVDEMKNSIANEQMNMMNELKTNSSTNNEPCGELIFTRIREVKAPGKAHPTDAGIDFYVPNEKAWDDEFKDMVVKYSRNKVYFEQDGTSFYGLKFDGNVLEVRPNAHVAIPSGIKTIIPPGLAMMMVNKSGIATKLKLDHSACLIDSEYRDELIFCFFNHNTEPVRIEPGMKITQGLIVPVINLNIQEVLNCVYDDMGKETDRGGGFGSSGTK